MIYCHKTTLTWETKLTETERGVHATKGTSLQVNRAIQQTCNTVIVDKAC